MCLPVKKANTLTRNKRNALIFPHVLMINISKNPCINAIKYLLASMAIISVRTKNNVNLSLSAHKHSTLLKATKLAKISQHAKKINISIRNSRNVSSYQHAIQNHIFIKKHIHASQYLIVELINTSTKLMKNVKTFQSAKMVSI